MERLKAFLRREVRQVSTWAGMVIIAASEVAPQFAAYDRRIAWAGMAMGVVAVVWREKPRG